MNNRGESSGSDGKNGIYDSHDSHSSHKSHQPAGFRCTVNAPARTRTLDPVIKSHLLYQLSYKGGQVCVSLTNARQKLVCYPPWQGLQVQVVAPIKVEIAFHSPGNLSQLLPP